MRHLVDSLILRRPRSIDLERLRIPCGRQIIKRKCFAHSRASLPGQPRLLLTCKQLRGAKRAREQRQTRASSFLVARALASLAVTRTLPPKGACSQVTVAPSGNCSKNSTSSVYVSESYHPSNCYASPNNAGLNN